MGERVGRRGQRNGQVKGEEAMELEEEGEVEEEKRQSRRKDVEMKVYDGEKSREALQEEEQGALNPEMYNLQDMYF